MAAAAAVARASAGCLSPRARAITPQAAPDRRHRRWVIEARPVRQNLLGDDQQRLGIEIAAPLDVGEGERRHRLGGTCRVAAERGERDVERAPAQRRRLADIPQPVRLQTNPSRTGSR